MCLRLRELRYHPARRTVRDTVCVIRVTVGWKLRTCASLGHQYGNRLMGGNSPRILTFNVLSVRPMVLSGHSGWPGKAG